jgi:hypothetical protein
LRSARGRNSLAIAAEGGNSSSSLRKGATTSRQASRVRSQHRPIHAFEPWILFGMKIETTKYLFRADPLSMFTQSAADLKN